METTELTNNMPLEGTENATPQVSNNKARIAAVAAGVLAGGGAAVAAGLAFWNNEPEPEPEPEPTPEPEVVHVHHYEATPEAPAETIPDNPPAPDFIADNNLEVVDMGVMEIEGEQYAYAEVRDETGTHYVLLDADGDYTFDLIFELDNPDHMAYFDQSDPAQNVNYIDAWGHAAPEVQDMVAARGESPIDLMQNDDVVVLTDDGITDEDLADNVDTDNEGEADDNGPADEDDELPADEDEFIDNGNDDLMADDIATDDIVPDAGDLTTDDLMA